jgi:hypothetical protein
MLVPGPRMPLAPGPPGPLPAPAGLGPLPNGLGPSPGLPGPRATRGPVPPAFAPPGVAAPARSGLRSG